MPFKIVRNDITKMTTEAIVNTANNWPTVGTGCDFAIYQAAGHDQLLAYRKEKIGKVPEGEVFITPGFNLPAKYIIHAVSPHYIDGNQGEEERLRSCYRKSLAIAKGNGIKSISFPLISTGGFGYPKEEGLRIALDEINAFLMGNEMEVNIVVFGVATTNLGGKVYPGLEEYIDENYVNAKKEEEYAPALSVEREKRFRFLNNRVETFREVKFCVSEEASKSLAEAETSQTEEMVPFAPQPCATMASEVRKFAEEPEFDEEHESKLAERIQHLGDTYSQYLLYLIEQKGLKNADVWKRGIVDRKVFSKIKNDVNYHPTKATALCLCVGAKLNLDETKDLLARAGYALSPSDMSDVIFSYFIENGIYDMIGLDIVLEEHGLPHFIE